ncbi:MAG TPA: pyridoxamine 5'-phosphate oxidase family protein [Tepidisphaeraceae bacterium]|jgi:general stress protein 26
MAKESKKDLQAKLWKMIKGIQTAMLTTACPDGSLRSRPMATQRKEFDGNLWFFTGVSSEKVHEIENDQHVNLAYADPSKDRYVSVSGTGRIVRDRQKMKELWNPIVKAYFPGGLDDPEIALLRVTVNQAEYWDAPGGRMIQLFGIVKAAVTGKPARPGENKKVRMEGV